MSGQEGILGLLIQYLPSIVITAGNFIVPMLCDQIAVLERYTPSLTIILALLRFARGDLTESPRREKGLGIVLVLFLRQRCFKPVTSEC